MKKWVVAIAIATSSCATVPTIRPPAIIETPSAPACIDGIPPVVIRLMPNWEKNYDPIHPTWPRNTD